MLTDEDKRWISEQVELIIKRLREEADRRKMDDDKREYLRNLTRY